MVVFVQRCLPEIGRTSESLRCRGAATSQTTDPPVHVRPMKHPRAGSGMPGLEYRESETLGQADARTKSSCRTELAMLFQLPPLPIVSPRR